MTIAASHPQLMEMYRLMVLIRQFEQEAERQYKAAQIGGYCHLSSGQEAVTVGAVEALEPEDLMVTGYRCHGFALARGVPPESVMAELFGRQDGCAHGRGGSMHLLDVSRGYFGGWGIVAGQLPIATGIGLALVRQGRKQAVLCELGDGAVNMGAWHESLNLAALWELPIVFLIVNNKYGMGTSVDRAAAEPALHKRAEAFRMTGERVDGDDLLAVIDASEAMLMEARTKRRPAVLEAVTYRHRGHSVADAGIAYRAKAEIEEHQRRDPIGRLKARLRKAGAKVADFQEAEQRAAERVEQAVKFAEESEPPGTQSLAAGMYAPGSDEQFRRMRIGSPFGQDELVYAGGLGQ